MEFEGSVVQLLPQVKGVSARGEWVKQEVIFEQTGEFGRKICVSFWGDKAQDVAMLKPGDRVKVAANVESREYNGRWYTEVRAWKVEKDQAASSASPSADYGWGAPASPAGGLPPLSAEEPAKEEFDDLPF